MRGIAVANRTIVMTLTTLMYASVSRLHPRTATDAVDGLVRAGGVRNARHGITGALLFTETYFVQIIEGPTAAVASLWANLQCDPRHEGLVLTHQGLIAERRFDGWDLAYSGPAQYVSKHVGLLFDTADPATQARSARWLANLMREFSDA